MDLRYGSGSGNGEHAGLKACYHVLGLGWGELGEGWRWRFRAGALCRTRSRLVGGSNYLQRSFLSEWRGGDRLDENCWSMRNDSRGLPGRPVGGR